MHYFINADNYSVSVIIMMMIVGGRAFVGGLILLCCSGYCFVWKSNQQGKNVPFNIWILRYNISLQSFHKVFVVTSSIKLFHFFLLDFCFVLEVKRNTPSLYVVYMCSVQEEKLE